MADIGWVHRDMAHPSQVPKRPFPSRPAEAQLRGCDGPDGRDR